MRRWEEGEEMGGQRDPPDRKWRPHRAPGRNQDLLRIGREGPEGKGIQAQRGTSPIPRGMTDNTPDLTMCQAFFFSKWGAAERTCGLI